MKKMIFALAAMTAFQAHAGITIEQIYGKMSVNESACFTRNYSATHMAKKPRQTVEQIKIKLYKYVYGDQNVDSTNSLAIEVKRKGEDKVWTNQIACMDNESKGNVICAVDCDGGSVEVMSIDGNGKMVLKNNGVLLYGGCGEIGPNGEEVESIFLQSKRGGDDVFALRQTDASACANIKDTWESGN